MSKELRCRDVGFDCDAVVTADTDDDVLAQVVDHGRSVHGLTDDQLADPGLQDNIRGQIHERA